MERAHGSIVFRQLGEGIGSGGWGVNAGLQLGEDLVDGLVKGGIGGIGQVGLVGFDEAVDGAQGVAGSEECVNEVFGSAMGYGVFYGQADEDTQGIDILRAVGDINFLEIGEVDFAKEARVEAVLQGVAVAERGAASPGGRG